MDTQKKVLLIVRDGWGYSPNIDHNMIAQAHTPYTDYLEKDYPTFLLAASGEEVGLPAGYFGNSEVGHMTIGAGRVLPQSLLRIDTAIKDGSFGKNQHLISALESLEKTSTQKIHIVGLLQKEGVHASFDHLIGILETIRRYEISQDQVCLHVITDGRDAKKQNAYLYISELLEYLEETQVGKIVSLAGRFYSMDRNENWDRTKKYTESILGNSEQKFNNIKKLFEEKYSDIAFSDEYLEPHTSEDFSGMHDGDIVLVSNFRKDRARQITKILSGDFSTEISIPDIELIAFTEYYPGIKKVIFPDLIVKDTLGEVISLSGLTQRRIAETEKFAHVTFFFDGGKEVSMDGREDILVPSPRVKNFKEAPKMSAEAVARAIEEGCTKGVNFIVSNFANADMVGHSGDHKAIKESVEYLDQTLESLIPKALGLGYTIILTADHGNAEEKVGDHETSHTRNPVPTTVISKDSAKNTIYSDHDLGLKNIAGFILSRLGIDSPDSYCDGLMN